MNEFPFEAIFNSKKTGFKGSLLSNLNGINNFKVIKVYLSIFIVKIQIVLTVRVFFSI